MTIEWKPNLSVGDDALDSQHKRLLRQINDLIAALKAGEGKVEIKGSISFLDKYINQHLAYEEAYMQEHKYPELEWHKEIHRGFIRVYGELKEELVSKGATMALILKFQKFIGDWWVNHIGTIDHKYYLFVKAQSESSE